MKVLLTSVGRRVELVRAFRQALPTGEILATDMDPTAPGLYSASRGFVSPPVARGDFVPWLLRLCLQEQIQGLVPLIDPELPVLARARGDFASVGTTVLVASPAAVETCFDKLKTAAFLASLGVPVPQTFGGSDLRLWRTRRRGRTSRRAGRKLYPETLARRFPNGVVVKPRRGSAGKGVNICRSAPEIGFWLRRTPEPLVQQLLSGEEITTDVFCDQNGKPVAQVQRRRLKIRAGEVERGVTMYDPVIAGYCRRIAARLAPVGAINIQCIRTAQGPFFTEVNPRFGGGYPLAHAAGARFPEFVVALLSGHTWTSGDDPGPGSDPDVPGYRTGLVMMRFDDALYRPEGELIRD